MRCVLRVVGMRWVLSAGVPDVILRIWSVLESSGDRPSIAGMHAERRRVAEAIRMIRHWLKVRSAWLPYLNLGTMRHAPVPAEEGSGEVVTSAWESPEGSLALFASNATGTQQKVILDLPADSDKPWRAWRNDRAEEIKAPARIERELDPDETVVIERCGARAGAD